MVDSIVQCFCNANINWLTEPSTCDRNVPYICTWCSCIRNKSDADLDCCGGVINVILICLHHPSKRCCEDADCNAGKHFYGQKFKYGLHCQAIHNADGQVLYPGSTTDWLALEGRTLDRKLKSLLAPGLHLVCDKAYLNVHHMTRRMTKPFQRCLYLLSFSNMGHRSFAMIAMIAITAMTVMTVMTAITALTFMVRK